MRAYYGGDRKREKTKGQEPLMQMVMLTSKNNRSKHERAHLARRRQSEDMPAESGAEVAAFMENGKEHA